MAENTKIEWADHTFNPWIGCQKVSAACDNCYAEDWANRFGQVEWGPQAMRKRTSAGNWAKPVKWNQAVMPPGKRQRVFCASLADVFDNRAPAGAREDLWSLIRSTPSLDWMLLTKRPQNIAKMLPDDWGPDGYANVWLGTTVESQEEAARRTSHLISAPAARHFLSCEPLLGPVDLTNMVLVDEGWVRVRLNALAGRSTILSAEAVFHETQIHSHRIDWVICGGESGPNARPMHPDWARSLRDQCQAAGVPFFFKQWGEWWPLMPGWVQDPGDLILWPDGVVAGAAADKADIPTDSSASVIRRRGKKAAGRLLDGRTWDEMPPVGP